MSSRLQEELKQTRPWTSLHEEATVSITRTAAVLDHALAQALKPFGITATQYNVLRILRGAGPDGLCRNEAGERLVCPVPDVTRLLDRMEQLGLIDRRRSDGDRRFVTTVVTDRGLELVGDLDRLILAFHEKRLAHLNPDDLRALIGLLESVRAEGT